MNKQIIKKEDIYRYHGDYVTFKVLKTRYYKKLIERSFFGIPLKDKKTYITEDEYYECINDGLYNYKWLKTYRENPGIVDTYVLAFIFSDGLPFVYRERTIEILNLETLEKKIEKDISSDYIPNMFIEFSCFCNSEKIIQKLKKLGYIIK